MAGSARRSRRPFGACQENSGSREKFARLRLGGEVGVRAPLARWWCRSPASRRERHACSPRHPRRHCCSGSAPELGAAASAPPPPSLQLAGEGSWRVGGASGWCRGPGRSGAPAPWQHTGLVADLPGVGTSAVPTPPRRKIHMERRGAAAQRPHANLTTEPQSRELFARPRVFLARAEWSS